LDRTSDRFSDTTQSEAFGRFRSDGAFADLQRIIRVREYLGVREAAMISLLR
jgi:hypothetical protein